MDIFVDLLKIVAPAGLVLWAMYATVTAFLQKEIKEHTIKKEEAVQKIVLPTRIQAFERFCLYLERIRPEQLLIRSQGQAQNVVYLHQLLLKDIREEFAHNVSQQVYISENTWLQLKYAMNETIALINTVASSLPPDAAAIELSKKLMEAVLENNQNPIDEALAVLKKEFNTAFISQS